MAMTPEEAQVVLHEILEEVVNGRVTGHLCPFCGQADLNCSVQDGVVAISCPGCLRKVDGVLR